MSRAVRSEAADSAYLDDGTGAVPITRADQARGLNEAVAHELPAGTWIEIARGTWDGERVSGPWRVTTRPRQPNAPAAAHGRGHERKEGEWAHFARAGKLHRLHERARALKAVRSFFEQEGFLEVEPPSVVPSPGMDLHLDAVGVDAAPFGATGTEPRWLITSPEYQLKRLLVGGADRVFSVARCWRASERGRHHEPEFTMIEWYRAFESSEALMRDTEALVAQVVCAVAGRPLVTTDTGAPIDLSPPWRRLRVAEAFARYADEPLEKVLPDEEAFFRILVERVEPALARSGPTFLTHWPASMASLARIDPSDSRYCDRFEAYVGGLELCNGFGELVDPIEQRARFERDQEARRLEGKVVYPIDERFLSALEEGMPPAAGNALGFDRVVMLATGAKRIADVMAFPQERL